MGTWVKPSGIEINLNDEPATVDKAKSLKWVIKGEKGAKSSDKLDDMDADDLEKYAKSKFNVDLDKRRKVGALRDQVRELENGDV